MNRTITRTLMSAFVLGILTSAVVFRGGHADEKVIRVTAKKFEFSPSEITVKKDDPLVLELTSQDRMHGFSLPDFGVRTDVKPGEVSRIRITPDKTGRFEFHCDNFCGSGHEDMTGTFVVTE